MSPAAVVVHVPRELRFHPCRWGLRLGPTQRRRLLCLPKLVIAPSGGEVVHSLQEVLPIVDFLVGVADLVFLLLFISFPRNNLHG